MAIKENTIKINKMKKIIVSLVIMILIFGCALESKFGLPSNEKANQDLIGVWLSMDKPADTIFIETLGEKRYKIYDKEGGQIGYSTTIKGHHILNIVSEYEGEEVNIFYGFDIKNDTVQFFEVNEKLKKHDFNSQAELIDFFNENIERPDFFVSPFSLIRKPE
ncbi:MAG TPA: hypothetical protein ENK46_02720 [Flavobacteriia bacterium]|jgi:hypothetical protein|nr:hypothetical protein [Flavobacteriia bacterium]